MCKKYLLNGTFVEVSDKVYAYLKKSDRKIRYFEEDLKVERYIIDSEKAKVTIIPSREDSIDRMMEFGADFQSESDDFRANTILQAKYRQNLSILLLLFPQTSEVSEILLSIT